MPLVTEEDGPEKPQDSRRPKTQFSARAYMIVLVYNAAGLAKFLHNRDALDTLKDTLEEVSCEGKTLQINTQVPMNVVRKPERHVRRNRPFEKFLESLERRFPEGEGSRAPPASIDTEMEPPSEDEEDEATSTEHGEEWREETHPPPQNKQPAHSYLASMMSQDAQQENETVMYTDGSYSGQQAGAGVFVASAPKQAFAFTFAGIQNALTAELVALREAVRVANKEGKDAVIYTDSLTSLFLIRKWIHRPNAMKYHRHRNLISTIVEMAQGADYRIRFVKVRAHVGIPGNENADILAKYATVQDRENAKVPTIANVEGGIVGQHLKDTDEPLPGGWRMANKAGKHIQTLLQLEQRCEKRHIETVLRGDQPQQQKVQRLIFDVCKSADTNPKRWPNIMGTASIWNNAISDPQRAVYLKHIWDRVYTPNSPGHPLHVKGAPNICAVCHVGPICAAHIRGGCSHKQMRAEYTHRHNACVATQTTFLRRGEEGHRYVLTDDGKQSELEPVSNITVDPRLLREEESHRIWKPDMVIIEDLEQHEELLPGEKHQITIHETKIIADETKAEELACSAREKYAECVKALERAGHTVELLSFVFGSRVPITGDDLPAFKHLHLTSPQQRRFLQTLWNQSLSRLHRTHVLYRQLEHSLNTTKT